jgi:hypothetical protein
MSPELADLLLSEDVPYPSRESQQWHDWHHEVLCMADNVRAAQVGSRWRTGRDARAWWDTEMKLLKEAAA